MATSDPASKVQDPEYKNWLRVGLALYYLKHGIMSFVKEAVDAMHQKLYRKLYGEISVPVLHCTSCKHENVRQIRGIWKMSPPCPSKVCDTWLVELLVLHTKPERIYPANCDVTAWPFAPWECAKLYMPRGQIPKNTGPIDCDTQAILSLMTNCTQFHAKMSPQGQSLIQKVITIRNIVMHSEDLKITYSARKKYIEEIIQLLKDPCHLQSLKACQNAVADISKINNDSEDAFFNLDLERKVLRECIEDIKQELGEHRNKVEKSIDALKEEFRECQKNTIQSLEEKMDTKLEEQDERCRQMIDTNMTQLLQLVGYTSSPGLGGEPGIPGRRRESEGLKQLKSRTENSLDAMKKLGFIPTRQAVEADNLLQKNKCLVIKGNPGEGKTTTSLYLIDKEKYRNQRVVIKSLDDWKLVDTNWVKIVVVEDIFGRFDLDPGLEQGWMLYLQDIQSHIDARQLEVIITTRTDVLAKATHLGDLPFLSDEFSFTLSSDSLERLEKFNILNRELEKRKKVLEDNEKEKCILNFQGLLGFPQCCSLFAGDETLFKEGTSFFKHPEKMFYVNIRHLKSGFLSLAFLFCLGEISEEFLSDEMMPEPNKNLLLELVAKLKSHFNISEKDVSMNLLRDSYELYAGVYVVKSDMCINFPHATVYEAVGRVLGELCPEILIKYCSLDFLHQKVYAAKSKDKSSFKVFVPLPAYGHLAERLMKEVSEERHVQIVIEHSALKQQHFWKMLRKQCLQCNKVNEFLTTELTSLQGQSNQDLGNGEVRTFLQCTLKKDVNTVVFAFDQLSEFLECSHISNTIDCWQCMEKQNLLEISLYYRHFDIADKMLKMNAALSRISLSNAARHGNLEWVKLAIENLKQKKAFDLNQVRESLCKAFISGNQNVIECLLKENIIMDLGCIIHVAKHGNALSVANVIAHLKKYDKWESVSYDASTALLNAFLDRKNDILDLLIKEGVSLTMEVLTLEIKPSVLKSLIQHLQNTNHWDQKSPHASRMLQLSYSREMEDNVDLLIQEGVVLTMKDLCGSAMMRSKYVARVICHLKDNNNWDCKSPFARKALMYACRCGYCDAIDLLHKEGVSLTMEDFPELVTCWSSNPAAKVIQHLKDINQWDTKSPYVLTALIIAQSLKNNDAVDELHQEGVSSSTDVLLAIQNSFLHMAPVDQENVSASTMEQLPDEVLAGVSSFLDVLMAMKNGFFHMLAVCQESVSAATTEKLPDEVHAGSSKKDIEKFDVIDLQQKGISLAMFSLQGVVMEQSVEQVTKVIEHLKNTNQWDYNSPILYLILGMAYIQENDDVIDLLHNEGVSPTWELILISVVGSSGNMKKEIKRLKDTNQWNPQSYLPSVALLSAFLLGNYDAAELLQQEGVSLSMDKLDIDMCTSLKLATRLIQHLKDTNQWDPTSQTASLELYRAYYLEKNDIIDLLHKEGVLLTMKGLTDLVIMGSSKYVSKAIQHLKDRIQWNPESSVVQIALYFAHLQKKIDVVDLLYQEGVSSMQQMNETIVDCDLDDLFHQEIDIIMDSLFKFIVFRLYMHATKVIECLKNINKWDPTLPKASDALLYAYLQESNDGIDLLHQEGVSLTMHNLLVYVKTGSSKQASQIIQDLKNTNQWEPGLAIASRTLLCAYWKDSNDVIALLHQEGVSLASNDFRLLVMCGLTKHVKKEIQHLKGTGQEIGRLFFPALVACSCERTDLINLLYEEVPILLAFAAFMKGSSEQVIQLLKNDNKWDPSSLFGRIILPLANVRKNSDLMY